MREAALERLLPGPTEGQTFDEWFLELTAFNQTGALMRRWMDGTATAEDHKQILGWLDASPGALLPIVGWAEVKKRALARHSMPYILLGGMHMLLGLPVMHERIQQEPEEGLKLVMEAHDAGLAHASFFLAMCYIDGRYLPKDVDKGVEFMLHAHHQGYLRATTALAMNYATGFCPPKHYGEALRLYYVAGAGGYNQANTDFDRLRDKAQYEGVLSVAYRWLRHVFLYGPADPKTWIPQATAQLETQTKSISFKITNSPQREEQQEWSKVTPAPGAWGALLRLGAGRAKQLDPADDWHPRLNFLCTAQLRRIILCLMMLNKRPPFNQVTKQLWVYIIIPYILAAPSFNNNYVFEYLLGIKPADPKEQQQQQNKTQADIYWEDWYSELSEEGDEEDDDCDYENVD